MYRWGSLIARRPRQLLALCLCAVALAAGVGLGVFDHLSEGGFTDPAAESTQVDAALRAEFPAQAVDLTVIYRSAGRLATDPDFERSVRDSLAAARTKSDLVATTYYDTHSPGLLSTDRHATLVLIALPGSGDADIMAAYQAVKGPLTADGLTTTFGGAFPVFDDVDRQVKADIARAEAISTPIVLLLSLVIFGSLAAALMPTMVGGVAVLGAFCLVRLLTTVADVSVFSINVITLMGMGLAIDYALFIVSRFREELRSPTGPDEALPRTLATAGRTVLFSGVIVAASLSSLLLFPQTYLKSMGYGGMAAVVAAMTASLTILPATLALLGPRIEWGRLPGRHSGRHVRPRARWAQIATHVMRHPTPVLLVTAALLVVLGGPLLGAHWGGVDERVLPQGSPSRVAAETTARLFGGETSAATIVLRDAPVDVTEGYRQALEEVPGVTGASLVDQRSSERPTAVLRVTWQGNSQTEASQHVLRDLRSVTVPEGTTAQIGGPTAETVDLVDAVRRTLPRMAGLVAVVMFVLLFAAFGSVVLPVKAMLMNTVSLAASFGAVTWIFQDGHLSGLLGFTPTGFLDVTQPILMLAVLFGLSMDYEVFLLSRVREDWDATGDNTAAVARGLQHTGGIITSAALLLAVVIGSFATSGIVFVKLLGVGMLVAVLLDATVVRALLVPATMRLLGAVNWWAPGPLRRWWERNGHRAG